MKRLFGAVGLAAVLAAVAGGQPPAGGVPPGGVSFRVVGWNLESGESSDDLLAAQVAAKKGVHIWGLSEVTGQKTLDKLVAAAGPTHKGVLGTTGNNDRLAVIYDAARFDLLGVEELMFITLAPPGTPTGQRAPLVAHFKGKGTGKEFLFVSNHLSRDTSGTPKRKQQAILLNQWVRTVPADRPVVMVGDFNFDFEVVNGDAPGRHDAGYDELTRDGKFVWVRPDVLVKTQASRSHNTVLDFVFVGNVPFGWAAESRILRRETDTPLTAEEPFPDNAVETDHRPVDAVFHLFPTGPLGGAVVPPAPAVPLAQPADRAALEAEIRDLRRRLADLESRLPPLGP